MFEGRAAGYQIARKERSSRLHSSRLLFPLHAYLRFLLLKEARRMKSPFEDLQIDPGLVCEFFAAFARFEYAMKATRYCDGDRHGNARPDWVTLKSNLGDAICHDEAAQDAIDYLLAEPPMIQKLLAHRAEFRDQPLDGNNRGAQAIEAAKRVRNNLFHGGKHTPHSPPERDTKLVSAALTILQACLSADHGLNGEFEHQLV